jgi:hypothetical protein
MWRVGVAVGEGVGVDVRWGCAWVQLLHWVLVVEVWACVWVWVVRGCGQELSLSTRLRACVRACVRVRACRIVTPGCVC